MKNISNFLINLNFKTKNLISISDFNNLSLLRQYLPISLLNLQRLIDTGRIDTNEPIDLTTLCNTKIVKVESNKREFGIQLTDEVFKNFNF
jgi:large subunit ribosomal protein L15